MVGIEVDLRPPTAIEITAARFESVYMVSPKATVFFGIEEPG
jgi:hypothetical protein